MEIKRVIDLQKDQLERYKALKMSCATCIDDETIEAQIRAIEYLEELDSLHHAYNELNQTNEELIKENEKLKKAIKFLKENINIRFKHIPKSKYYDVWIGPFICYTSKQEYELLKEVLE